MRRSSLAPFPWSDAMSFGLGVLRLPPECFWSMTPRELHAAWRANVPDADNAPLRASLAKLMAQFPDA